MLYSTCPSEVQKTAWPQPSLLERAGARWQIVADDHEHHVDLSGHELQRLEDDGTAKPRNPATVFLMMCTI